MCDSNKTINCEHPEWRPCDGNCSKELIEKCHGSTKEHPCNSEKK